MTPTAIIIGVVLFLVAALALRWVMRRRELRAQATRQLSYWNTIQRPQSNVIDITPALERRRASGGGR